jgi:hypothetical protein
MAQQAAKLDQFPTDVGLLPGTFIRPTGVNLPSIFSSPKDRLTLELRWAKTRVTDIAGYALWIRTCNRATLDGTQRIDADTIPASYTTNSS